MNQFNPEEYELDKEASTSEKLVYNKKPSPEHEYKVGDKVIVIAGVWTPSFASVGDELNSVSVGDELEVVDVLQNGCDCRANNGNVWFFGFKEIKPSPKHEYKVGDKVIAVTNGGYQGTVSGGDELEVVEAFSYGCDCRAKNGKVLFFSFKEIKPAQKHKYNSYEDIANVVFKDGFFYTENIGSITHFQMPGRSTDPNNAATAEQLENMLERNKLKTVANFLNGDWEPEFDASIAYILIEKKGEVEIRRSILVSNLGVIYYKSRKIAEETIRILGEESILKALKA